MSGCTDRLASGFLPRTLLCLSSFVLHLLRSNGSLNLHDWSITGICAAYFHGTAKITPCTKDGEESLGCLPALSRSHILQGSV